MRLLLPHLQLLDREPLVDGTPLLQEGAHLQLLGGGSLQEGAPPQRQVGAPLLQEGAPPQRQVGAPLLQVGEIPQSPHFSPLMPSPAGDAPLSAADVPLSAASHVPLPTDPAATRLPAAARLPAASGVSGAKRSIWSEHEAVPSSASSPPVRRPLSASQERRQQYTVPTPWEEGHSSRRQGERDVVLSSLATQVVEEAGTRVWEGNSGALGFAAAGSDCTAAGAAEAARNLEQQHAAERDELRADVVHMQEAFGQVQTMVQVRGGGGT